MKRLVVLAVLFSLAVSFAALQPAPVAAQSQNCFIHITQTAVGTFYYWATQTGTPTSFLSNILVLTATATSPSSGVIVVNKGVTGTVQVLSSNTPPANAGAGSPAFTTGVNCIDNNN